jgi:putative SOS response-associated peptidase YedK
LRQHLTDFGYPRCILVFVTVRATLPDRVVSQTLTIKQRTLDTLRWGLISNWAKDPKIAYKTINARVETVDTAPSFRQAFMKRRCLVAADGSFEWKKVKGGKIPYSIAMKDDSIRVCRIVGRLERSGERRVLHTCAIITGEPNEFVREIRRGLVWFCVEL